MRQHNLTDTEKIRAYLEERYPDADHRNNRVYKDFALQLWETFQKYDLQDNDFVEQFTSENIETHIQRYSEMLFAWHLVNLGYVLTSKGKGPDLCIEHNGQRIWVEIITPTLIQPSADSFGAQRTAQLINDYQAPIPINQKDIRLRDIPSEQILLRWTAALREKHHKLIGYLEKGIVQPEDPYLVAINSVLLGRHGFKGISQYSTPLEATFAVGPIKLTIGTETDEIINSGPSYRPILVKHNQANIPADTFLDHSYKKISGIIATHAGLEVAVQPNPPSLLVVVHNPNSVNPLPISIFGAKEEYIAEVVGDCWEIRDIHVSH
jgi:hypothetical protein